MSEKNKEIRAFLKGYKRVTEMSGEAMFIHDAKGTIFDVNKAAEKLTGYPRRGLLRMNVKQMHTGGEQKASEKMLGLISSSKVEVDFESRFRKKDGRVIDVRIIGDRFTFKSKSFVIELVKDITTHRKFIDKETAINMMPGKKFFDFFTPRSRAYTEPMQVLIELAESRDPYTMEHSAKVTRHAIRLAEAIGLPKKEKEILKLAAMFHDIGKIGIKERVLMKDTSLSNDEYEAIKKHPLLSEEVVRSIKPVAGLMPIIRHHHENYDGTGYPDGLKGDNIPLGARILSIADVYDALTSERAYRKAYSHRSVLRIMMDGAGKKFDPELLDHFLKCLSEQKQKKSAR